MPEERAHIEYSGDRALEGDWKTQALKDKLEKNGVEVTLIRKGKGGVIQRMRNRRELTLVIFEYFIRKHHFYKLSIFYIHNSNEVMSILIKQPSKAIDNLKQTHSARHKKHQFNLLAMEIEETS